MRRLKAAVMVLGVLAAGKIVMQDALYRGGTRDVLIGAYREHAIAACQRDQRTPGATAGSIWARPADVRVVIGKSDIDVWFWQIDNSLWNARYRNPYLHITADRGQQCEYDIVHGIATVYRS